MGDASVSDTSLTERDARFMQENGLTPEEFFDGRYYMDLRDAEFAPPNTTIPYHPPLIIVPRREKVRLT